MYFPFEEEQPLEMYEEEGPFVAQIERNSLRDYEDNERIVYVPNGPQFMLRLFDEEVLREFVAENVEIESDWDHPDPPEYSIDEILGDELEELLSQQGYSLADKRGDFIIADTRSIDMEMIKDVLVQLENLGFEAVEVDEDGRVLIENDTRDMNESNSE